MAKYRSKNPDNRIDLNNGNYCPPHRLGEGKIVLKILGGAVSDEPCHIHKSRLSHRIHHDPFCRIIACPHYQSMKEAERRYREQGSVE